jgi:SHS2 domain-containing protein
VRATGGESHGAYEFLEDIATADIAFRAWGETLEETFRAAADATLNVMVEDLDSVEPRARREMKLANEAVDLLLFDFLQELIYYKDLETLLLRVEGLRIASRHGRHILEASACGEAIDPGRHRLRVDVKAVTLHGFSVQTTSDGWEARVILDI